MHEEMRAWALSVCCACVCSAGIAMLVPERSGKKTLQWVISLIILCVMLRPLRAIGKRLMAWGPHAFHVSQYENPALEDEMEDSVSRYYAAFLEENLRRVLDGADIPYERITVTMDNSEDGRICMKQVEVIVKKEDETLRRRIEQLLTPYIGTEPTVRAE